MSTMIVTWGGHNYSTEHTQYSLPTVRVLWTDVATTPDC